MATEHGMAGPLRAGWRMAKVGFWWGVFGIATEALGLLLYGEVAEWRDAAEALPFWVVLAGVGGVLYGLFLSASVRGESAPAGGRALTGAVAGALAGALTAGLAVAASTLMAPLYRPLAYGVSHVSLVVMIGAVIGVAFGLNASLDARYGAPVDGGAGTGGVGGSPRLADRP